MDPPIYAIYLYFLIINEKLDSDYDGIRGLRAISTILSVAENSEYKQRMYRILGHIEDARKFLP